MSKDGSNDLLVFIVRRDTKCGECGCELVHGAFVTLEEPRGALCLACADLDHLDFLPRGDAALTRRARKHSRLSAVVLQWSRTRKRYERQGILAVPEAIDRAEQECASDEKGRAERRQRDHVKREAADREYVDRFAEQIRSLYPRCPGAMSRKIAEHTCRRHSGTVGRSAAARNLEAEAIALAVVAWVRHHKTRYDELLAGLHDRHEARAIVRQDVERGLTEWSRDQ